MLRRSRRYVDNTSSTKTGCKRVWTYEGYEQPIFVLLHEPLRGYYYESEAERTFKRRSDPVPGGMLSIRLPHLDEMALGFKGC